MKRGSLWLRGTSTPAIYEFVGKEVMHYVYQAYYVDFGEKDGKLTGGWVKGPVHTAPTKLSGIKLASMPTVEDARKILKGAKGLDPSELPW